jgi:aspartate aminotransferase
VFFVFSVVKFTYVYVPDIRSSSCDEGFGDADRGPGCVELKAQGHDIIDLSVGEPDFDTPEFVKELAREGLAKGLTKYTPSSGTKGFHDSVTTFFEKRFGAVVRSDEIAASCGGKQG